MAYNNPNYVQQQIQPTPPPTQVYLPRAPFQTQINPNPNPQNNPPMAKKSNKIILSYEENPTVDVPIKVIVGTHKNEKSNQVSILYLL